MIVIIFIVHCYFKHKAQRTVFMHVVRGKSFSWYKNNLYDLIAEKKNKIIYDVKLPGLRDI